MCGCGLGRVSDVWLWLRRVSDVWLWFKGGSQMCGCGLKEGLGCMAVVRELRFQMCGCGLREGLRCVVVVREGLRSDW